MGPQSSAKKEIQSSIKKLESEKVRYSVKEIQSLVHTAIDLIENHSNHRESTKKDLVNEVYNNAGGAIQRQIKYYITVIQENLPKFWSSQKERDLHQFLADCQESWTNLKLYFPFAPKDAVNWLTEATNALLDELREQRYEIELPDILEELQSQDEYWPSRKAEKAIGIASQLGKESEINAEIEIIEQESAKQVMENAESLVILQRLPSKFPILQPKRIEAYPKLKAFFFERNSELFELETLDKITNNLEKLEESICDAGYWSPTIDKDLMDILAQMPNNESQLELGLKILKLFKYYKQHVESGNFSLSDRFPEFDHQAQLVDLEYTEDGEYQVATLVKGEWIPGYRWEEKKIFPHANFHQEGEWKKRKFACEWWQLSGKVPVGTILLVSYKEEKTYYIVTHQVDQYKDHLRLIELGSHDVQKIKENQKQQHVTTHKKPSLPSFSSKFPFYKVFRNGKMIKLGLRLANLDRSNRSILGIAMLNVIKGNSKSNEILEQQQFIIEQLIEDGKAEKYLTFIKKQLINPPDVLLKLATPSLVIEG